MTVGFISECSSTNTMTIGAATTPINSSITLSSSSVPVSALAASTKNLETFTLLNDIEPMPSSCSSSTAAAIAASSSSNPTKTSAPETVSTNSSHNNLMLLKKTRAPAKSGRNHAGAKYLANQYTRGLTLIHLHLE